MEKIRRRKVYSKHRTRTYDTITIPEIRLEGKWLDKLGFKEGQQIVVQQEENKIILMVLNRAPQPTSPALNRPQVTDLSGSKQILQLL